METTQHLIAESEAGLTLAAVLRRHDGALSWNQARALCARGQVAVDGAPIVDPAVRLRAGQCVSVAAAPLARVSSREPRLEVLYADEHIVVIDKPAGLAAVPFQRGERGTALDRTQEALARREARRERAPLFVVHRIDKETSGALAFARTRKAERALGELFRVHALDRHYLAVAAGRVEVTRLESFLVRDRGDGRRGSTRASGDGQRAITNLVVREYLRRATLLEARLETGRTHQIRIQLAEAGHPVVGERVYAQGATVPGLPADGRLLLHAAHLAFDHPLAARRVVVDAPLPVEYRRQLTLLGATIPSA